jgi:tetratricopeptide (TPR) repeat protein
LLIARELGDRPVERAALTRLAHAMVGVGCLAEAAEVGQRALELSMELGGHVLAAESLAALARISMAEGNLALAQTHIEETLGLLEANSLEGTDEAFRVYLTCYHVLRQSQDPRAQRILAEAHRLLRARAARIGDDELRRSFLDGVPTHREIIKEAERLSTR